MGQQAWHVGSWVRLVQGSGKGSDESPTYVTLDMLEQLSSPAEKLAGPGASEGADLPEHSSKVSTDMESICEARTLPDSHSPLSSATSSLSHRYMLGVLPRPLAMLTTCSRSLSPVLIKAPGQIHIGLSCAEALKLRS